MLNRKSEIRPIVSALLNTYEVDGLEPFCIAFLEKLLQQKVTFPLLEFAAEATYQQLAEIEHLPFCKNIAAHHTMGGNVVGVAGNVQRADHIIAVVFQKHRGRAAGCVKTKRVLLLEHQNFTQRGKARGGGNARDAATDDQEIDHASSSRSVAGAARRESASIRALI